MRAPLSLNLTLRQQITCHLFLKFFFLSDLEGLLSNYYKYFISNIWQFPHQLSIFCCAINHFTFLRKKPPHTLNLNKDITQWIRTQLKFALNISLGKGTPYFYSNKRKSFTILRSFFFFNTYHAMYPWKMGSCGSCAFPWFSWCVSWWDRLVLSWDQVPFSLSSFSFWSFSFTHSRKLAWLFECLIHSLLTLILLVGILPLTCTFTTMHVGWHQRPFQICHNVTFLVDLHVCGQRSRSHFLRSLESL